MRSRSLWKALFVAPLLGAPALAAVGCEGGDGGECQTARTYFEQQVWGTVISSKCIKCHTPDGVAVAENGAKFVIQPSSYPGFMDANVKMMEDIAQRDVN